MKINLSLLNTCRKLNVAFKRFGGNMAVLWRFTRATNSVRSLTGQGAEEHLRSVEVMAQQLLSRHPEIGQARARAISLTLQQTIYSGLDAIALSQSQRSSRVQA